MELNLQDKVVVVTGGGTGIGKAVANAFAKEGCKIAICDISMQNLENAHKEFKDAGYEIFTKLVDVSKYEEVQGFADDVCAHYRKMDVWVNNAGILPNAFILDMDPVEWKRVMEVNLDSVFWGIQAAGRHMKESGGGVILNTSSFGGKISTTRRAPYTASKTGVNALVKLAAGELAPYNIRVNGVAPGSIETAMQSTRPAEERKKSVSRVALQRACTPEELALTYVFLGSNAASYITGTVVEVDGGKVCIQDPESAWAAAGK